MPEITANGKVAGSLAAPGLSSGSRPEDLRLALRAATMYYLDGLTQAEIVYAPWSDAYGICTESSVPSKSIALPMAPEVA